MVYRAVPRPVTQITGGKMTERRHTRVDRIKGMQDKKLEVKPKRVPILERTDVANQEFREVVDDPVIHDPLPPQDELQRRFDVMYAEATEEIAKWRQILDDHKARQDRIFNRNGKR